MKAGPAEERNSFSVRFGSAAAGSMSESNGWCESEVTVRRMACPRMKGPSLREHMSLSVLFPPEK